MFAHSIKNPHIIHMMHGMHYLCMRACSTTPAKSTRDKAKVTCKNCRREIQRCPDCGTIAKVWPAHDHWNGATYVEQYILICEDCGWQSWPPKGTKEELP